MKAKSIIIIAVFILAIAGAYYGISSLSLISGETEMYPDISCVEPVDCYNHFLDNGISKSELDASLVSENAKFICVSSVCGVQGK